jgi:uroporphyrinogen-III synthase
MKTNHRSLTGLTILITRPQHQSSALNELITTAGGKTIVLPTIIIESTTHHTAFQQIIKNINNYDIAIFVSANAVDNVMPFWQPRKSLTVIAIGPGTATALEKNHIAVDAVPVHFSSEGLLALPNLTQIQHKKIVIFCGENARPLLRDVLTERGANVDAAVTYRRRCPTLDNKQLTSIAAQPIDHIITASRESLENLFSLFQAKHDWLCQIPLLVISPAMALFAKQLGFHTVNIADNASDAAVVQALIRQVE